MLCTRNQNPGKVLPHHKTHAETHTQRPTCTRSQVGPPRSLPSEPCPPPGGETSFYKRLSDSHLHQHPPKCVQHDVPEHGHGTHGLTASPGARHARDPPGLCRPSQEGTKTARLCHSRVEGPSGNLSSQPAPGEPHPCPPAWTLPGTELDCAGLGSPGDQPCGSEHHQEPRSAQQERPSDTCQHITSGPPDASANVHPARSALFLRHAFF